MQRLYQSYTAKQLKEIVAVSAWQHECSKALDAVKAITEGEVLEVTVDAFPPAKFDENLPVIKGV